MDATGSTAGTEVADPPTPTEGSGMKPLVEDLRRRLETARRGGSESARRKHLDRGKLLARDRIDQLLDPGSPFLELSPLAATGMYGGSPTATTRCPRAASSPGSGGSAAASA